MNVQTKLFGNPHLKEVCQIVPSGTPKPVRHAIGLHRLVALEVQKRLQQPVAGRVAFVLTYYFGI